MDELILKTLSPLDIAREKLKKAAASAEKAAQKAADNPADPNADLESRIESHELLSITAVVERLEAQEKTVREHRKMLESLY